MLPDQQSANGYTYSYTPATCTEPGEEKYTYTKGTQTFEFTVEIPAKQHNYGLWTITEYPTKDAMGTLTRVCLNDAAHVDTFTLPMLPDQQSANGYTYSYTPATCTEPGEEKYTYTKGTQTFEFTVEIPAKQHNYGLWTITEYPTKDTTGTLTRVCVNDAAHVETFTLPALPDQQDGNGYTYSYTPPACNVTGEEKYTYTKDAQTFEFTVDVPAKQHNYGLWSVTLAPTKNTTGTLTRVCTNDPTHTETHTLPALNDLLYMYTLEPATCTVGGLETYVYRHGGQVFRFTVTLDALQHAYGAWTVGTKPTVDAAGTLCKVCANDPAHVETYTIPALNAQDYVYVLVTAPFCESNGVATYTYTFDTLTFAFTVDLPAIGHSYSEWVVSVAPTLTAGGELTRVCANAAEHKQTQAIPALSEAAYTYEVRKAATETEPGLAVYTYTYEGKTFEFAVELPALGTAEPEPATGFSWWLMILIILVILIILAALLWLFVITQNNDKNPPDAPIAPTALAEKENDEAETEEVEEAEAETEKADSAETDVAPVTVEAEQIEAVDAEAQSDVIAAEVASAAMALAILKRNGRKSIINVGDLDVMFADGDTVTLEILKAKGLIPKATKRYKVLANGTLNKALTVEADEFSPVAKDKILAAGGQTVKTVI